MRAVLFEQFGEPSEVLRIQDVPVPLPGPGEVRVRMLASPINPSDLMFVRGIYGKQPELPATPGFEGVGVVEAHGGGLFGKWLRGKRVAVLNRHTGNWQEQTIVPATQAVPLPRDLPTEQAAMFFVNPAAAYVMTRQILAVPKGDWLLQTAAGSALGRMVIRLGQHFGFRTLNIVRREEQVAELNSLGADAVLSWSPHPPTGAENPASEAEQLLALVLPITSGHRVRFAIDPLGGATGSAVVSCLTLGGRLLLFGTLCGEPLAFSPRTLMTSGATIQGFWLARWMQSQGLVCKLRLMRSITRLMRDGVLTSEVGATFPLDQIAEAVQAAEQPGRAGKMLLNMADT